MEKQFYNFVKEVYDKQLGVEGIAIADGEKILMEHHFTPDQARNIYSHTKSFEFTDMQGEKVYYGNYEFSRECITNRDRMFDCPQNLREEEMFEVPEWAANKVVYQIFPSRFAASQPIDKKLWYKAPITSKDDLHGDLRGIMDHLDHIQNLYYGAEHRAAHHRVFYLRQGVWRKNRVYQRDAAGVSEAFRAAVPGFWLHDRQSGAGRAVLYSGGQRGSEHSVQPQRILRRAGYRGKDHE